MDEFENIFDKALSDADSAIIETMGKVINVFINGVLTPVQVVFDEPENVDYTSSGAIRIEATSPKFFVKSKDVADLKRLSVVLIGTERYWVDRIGPDDTGSRLVYLGVGDPPANTRRG